MASTRAHEAAASAAHARNRWLVLGVLATVALAILVGLSLAGVFHRGQTRRVAVSAYIEEVNAAQRGVATDLQTVNDVYARVRADPAAFAGSSKELVRSTQTLRRLDRTLRALDPPPDARTLHRRLIAWSAARAAFAGEVVLLGVYLPALTAEQRAVGVAGSRLRRDLNTAADARAQVEAFARFAASLTAAAKRLARTAAPSALEPARARELSRTSQLAVISRSLATSLQAKRAEDSQKLLYQLSVSAAGAGNGVERRAVIAFDRQARRIDTLRLAVDQERQRLDRELR